MISSRFENAIEIYKSTSFTIGRCVSLFVLAFACWSQLSQDLLAGCGRERDPFHEVDLQRVTGLSSDKLTLMPTCRWVYRDGSMVIAFGSRGLPCNSPECQQRRELPQSSNAPIAPSTHVNSADYLMRPGTLVFVLEPPCIDILGLSHLSFDAFFASRLERPPILA